MARDILWAERRGVPCSEPDESPIPCASEAKTRIRAGAYRHRWIALASVVHSTLSHALLTDGCFYGAGGFGSPLGIGMVRYEKIHFLTTILFVAWGFHASAQEGFESDVIKTSSGDLKITFIGHGTLMFSFGGKIIHIDPVTREADFAKLPKADLVLVTHHHGDHLDVKALDILRTEKTQLILTEICVQRAKGGRVMKNGEVKNIDELKIEAVPAYNLVHMRGEGNPYHPRGRGMDT